MSSTATWNVPRAVAAVLVTVAVAGVPNPAVATPAFPAVQSFVMSSQAHSPSFITAQRGWALVGTRLLKTSEGGSRWSVSVPPEWAHTVARAISFSTPTRGWMVTSRGQIFVTSDGGATWTSCAPDFLAEHDLVAVQAIGDDRAIVISRDGLVAGTEDSGSTWTLRHSAGGVLSAIHFSDALHGWAAGASASGTGTLLATDDGGATWVARVAPLASALTAVTFADAAHGWAAGPAGVLSTSDGGATWVATAAPPELLGAHSVSVGFVSATHGFLGRSRSTSGGPVLWETTDGGAHWTPCAIAESSAGVTAIAVLSSTRVLATGVSTPAGESLTSAHIWRGDFGTSSASASSAASKSRLTMDAEKKAKAAAKKKAAKRAAAKRAAAAKKRAAAKRRAAKLRALRAKRR